MTTNSRDNGNAAHGKDRLPSEDIALIVAIVFCLILALGSIFTEFQRTSVSHITGGARPVDIEKVRKQISEGELSPKKAHFYKKQRH